MNHRPFEEWLLNDKQLTPTEKRELDAHLRTCKYCGALVETGFALRSARVTPPVAGFRQRFEQRLMRHKIAERRRRWIGLLVLLLVAGVATASLGGAYINAFLSSPLESFARDISFVLSLVGALRAVLQAVGILARAAPSIVPPYAWMVFLPALGLGLWWIVSFLRPGHAARGVSA